MAGGDSAGTGAFAWYVTNLNSAGTTSVVETRGLTVVANLATGTHPNTVAVDKRSGLAYVSNKARMPPRQPRPQGGQPGQPAAAPATPPAPPPPAPEDPNGDTVSIIRL